MSTHVHEVTDFELVPGDVLTVKQVATMLLFTPEHVRELASSGKLPAVKVGGCWRFNRQSITQWWRERERARGFSVSTKG